MSRTGRHADPGDPRMRSGDDPDRTSSEVPFSTLDGVAMVLWSIIGQILVFGPLLAAGLEPDDEIPSLLALVAAEVVIAGGVVAWLAARDRLSWHLLGRERPNWTRHVAAGLGVGAIGFVIVTATVMASDQLFGPFEAPTQSLLETTTTGGAATALGILIAVLLAPVVEETIFRGVLFQALDQRLGYGWAVVLSAAMFSAVHVEITQWALRLALFLLGAWFAVALRRWGSLVVPVVGHAVFNGIAVLLALTVVE